MKKIVYIISGEKGCINNTSLELRETSRIFVCVAFSSVLVASMQPL